MLAGPEVIVGMDFAGVSVLQNSISLRGLRMGVLHIVQLQVSRWFACVCVLPSLLAAPRSGNIACVLTVESKKHDVDPRNTRSLCNIGFCI